MTADVVLDRLYRTTGSIPRGSDHQKSGRCPAHDDRNASLSIRLDSDKVLLHCHAGCDVDAVLDSLELSRADLFTEPMAEEKRTQRPADDWIPCGQRGHTKVAGYDYRDERGETVMGVTRCNSKCFAQWRPDSTAKSGRRWKLTDDRGNRLVRTVPYRLPEMLKGIAEDLVVWVCEGEKDAHALVDRGLVATCNAGGAGKWTAEHAAFLKGADVTVVADRDDAGRRHAEQVVETLRGIARSVYVVQSRHGKDAFDHFAGGGNTGDFIEVWAPVRHPGDTVGGAN